MSTAITTLPAQLPSPPVDLWEKALDLACDLSIEIPVKGFTVRDLLQLTPQSVVSAQWNQSSPVPMKANHRALAWVEFALDGQKLCVRAREVI